MVHVVLGIALLIYGLIVLRRDRSRAGQLYGWSYIAGWISLTLWPADNSAVLDTLTRTPGLGRLLNDACAILSVVLQFAFISTLAGVWPRWRQLAMVVSCVLLALLVPLWFVVRLTVTRDFPQLFYRGYYAQPSTLLAWNVLVGFAIAHSCSLSFIGYVRALGAMRTRFTRATTLAAVVVYAAATVYGVLVMAQLAADRAGYGPTGVLHYTGPIVLGCVVATLSSTGVVMFGRKVWAYTRQWFSLTRKQMVLKRLLKDTINANVLLSDQRVYLERRADHALVRTVDDQCRTHGITSYQRKVARQAVRLVILEGDLPRPAASAGNMAAGEETTEPDYQALLADLSRRIEEDLHFLADAYRVARLVMLDLRDQGLHDDTRPELAPRREPRGWRHDVARLIVAVVRTRMHNESHTRSLSGDSHAPGTQEKQEAWT